MGESRLTERMRGKSRLTEWLRGKSDIEIKVADPQPTRRTGFGGMSIGAAVMDESNIEIEGVFTAFAYLAQIRRDAVRREYEEEEQRKRDGQGRRPVGVKDAGAGDRSSSE